MDGEGEEELGLRVSRFCVRMAWIWRTKLGLDALVVEPGVGGGRMVVEEQYQAGMVGFFV